MEESVLSEVWSTVHERVGEDLRAVVRFYPRNYETKLREDVDSKYDNRERQRVIDHVILEELGTKNTEAAVKGGDLLSLVRVFEDAWILSCTSEEGKKSGIIVSIERNGSNATMEDVQWCIDYLNDGDLLDIRTDLAA